MPPTRNPERGSVLIQVAVAILAMTAFSALVIDYGFMWVARGQAQNAADAAAHAGAVSLMTDYDPEDVAASENKAIAVATATAALNPVGGESPRTSTVDISVTDCAGDGYNDCLDAKVYRNAEKNNRLPVFFGGLLSTLGLGARAQATAKLDVGVGSDCLAPFAIPDKWYNAINKDGKDKKGVWESAGTFDYYCNKADGHPCDGEEKLGNKNTPYHEKFNTPDTYTAPSGSGQGTGYKFSAPNSDFGGKDGKGLTVDDLTTDPNTVTGDKQQPKATMYLPLDIPRADGQGGSGVTRYVMNFKSCNGTLVMLGDEVAYLPGVAGTDTEGAINDIVATDPTACWGTGKRDRGGCDTKVNAIQNSCITSPSGCAAPSLTQGQSPRVIQLPLYDPQAFEDCRLGRGSCGGYGAPRLRITNMAGCFLANNGKTTDGKFTCYLMPVEAVSCTQAKAKGKKGRVVTCPPTSFDSFLRNASMYR